MDLYTSRQSLDSTYLNEAFVITRVMIDMGDRGTEFPEWGITNSIMNSLDNPTLCLPEIRDFWMKSSRMKPSMMRKRIHILLYYMERDGIITSSREGWYTYQKQEVIDQELEKRRNKKHIQCQWCCSRRSMPTVSSTLAIKFDWIIKEAN